MNPELYTDEFRSFKFLKSPRKHVEYFRASRAAANKIQPVGDSYDPTFVWPHRIEFLEQIVDLRYDTIYIIVSNVKYNSIISYKLENPMIVTCNSMVSSKLEEVKEISSITESLLEIAYLCSEETYKTPMGSAAMFPILSLPVVPNEFSHFTELFYNEETSKKYADALTDYFRYTVSTVSTLSKWL